MSLSIADQIERSQSPETDGKGWSDQNADDWGEERNPVLLQHPVSEEKVR